MSSRGWTLFLALSVIWGVPYFLIKVALVDLAPEFVVAGRLVLAALILLPVAAFRGQLRGLRPYLWWIVALAAVEMALPFGLLAWAETRVSSSLAGLFIAAVPLLTAVLAATLGLSDRLDAVRFVGLGVGLAGVVLLVGLDWRSDSAWALIALFGVAVGYAVGPILLSTTLRAPPGLGVMAAATGVAALAYLPALLLSRPSATVTVQSWAAVVVLGVVCTAVAFIVFYSLIAEVGPTRMTVITYINPVVAVTLGVLVLHEPVTIGIAVGFPLILIGSVVATRRRTDRRRDTEPIPRTD